MAPLKNIFLFCLITSFSSFSQSLEPPAAFNSTENILRFADFLFCSGDYYRASLEYERLLSVIKNDTIVFKTALGYSMTENYNEARKYFNQIKASESLFSFSRGEYYKTYLLENDFSSVIQQSVNDSVSPDPSIQKLVFSAMLLNGSPPEEDKFLSTFTDDQEMKEFYERKTSPESRSPLAAGIFSAIIPGSGKIYTGQYWDGVFAFLSTGVLVFLAYDNFDAGHDTRAWIFTGLAGLFYAGNIYGSAASAFQFNLNVAASFDADFKLALENRNYFLPRYDFCR